MPFCFVQNILIDETTMRVYLCDFGFATYYDHTTRFEKWCGSPHTVAPEIIQRIPYFGPGVDVWSLGSVLYTMICAYFPFQASVPKDVLKRTVLGKIHSFPSGCGSRAVRDLISRCLVTDPGMHYFDHSSLSFDPVTYLSHLSHSEENLSGSREATPLLLDLRAQERCHR